ncbi:MAG: TonB family protein [Acidobacteria bacterium]|nr:TonB family protein [Acidobacteriota bacterium]
MDPVSRVLEDRSRFKRPWLPWIVIAVMLHGLVGVTVILAARMSPHHVMVLPSVSVQLVHLPRRHGPTAPKGAPAPAAVAAHPTPVPTARPKPTPAPRKPAALPPKQVHRPPSSNAMPAIGSKGRTPTPTPAPAGGRGLQLAGRGEAGQPAIPSDFQFTYYVQRMLALIEGHWYKPPAPPGTRAVVRFQILRSGQLVNIEIEQGSGVPSFDRAALRAMYATNPLPPLPPGYGPSSLTVHLAFTE